MIGPEFLSTFQLKPIETILDWENARRWKVYFESEIYRRRCLESTAIASEDSSPSVNQTPYEDSTTTHSPPPGNLSAPENLIDTDSPDEAADLDDTEDYSRPGKRRRRYSDVQLPETLTMELTLNEVVHILDVMTNHFDRNHWSMVEGDLMKEIRFRMRRQGFRNRDLVEEIGSKGYVSDILNRRKPLTLRTARIFRDFFDIPAEWLLGDYLDCEVPD
jgi:HTH-type transcriptional regulator/antitoxin HigA